MEGIVQPRPEGASPAHLSPPLALLGLSDCGMLGRVGFTVRVCWCACERAHLCACVCVCMFARV